MVKLIELQESEIDALSRFDVDSFDADLESLQTKFNKIKLSCNDDDNSQSYSNLLGILLEPTWCNLEIFSSKQF